MNLSSFQPYCLSAPPSRVPAQDALVSPRFRNASRGSALITALVFTVIIAITLAGVGTLTVSHYALAHTQADSTAALDLAEAGINHELNYLTEHQGQADPQTTYTAAAAVGAGLTGQFTVVCTNPDGTPWTGATLNANTVTITSSANVNGATRKVVIAGQPTGTFYTLYSTQPNGYIQFLGNNDVVNGTAGTDGQLYIPSNLTTKPVIQGLVFNGSKAKWFGANPDPTTYKPVTNANTPVWPTVDSIVNTKFPGGQAALAANNDNNGVGSDGKPLAALSDPANPGADPRAIIQNQLVASGNQVVTLHGKPGGANYYLNTLTMSGNSNLIFDNSNGPINIFYIPPTSGSNQGQGAYVRGGHALESLLQAPNNPVNLYSAATGNLNVTADAANDEIDMGIYAYNTLTNANPNLSHAVGGVILGNNINFRGQIIANTITAGTGVQITGQRGYFDTPPEYFGFSGAWRELSSSGTIGGGNQ